MDDWLAPAGEEAELAAAARVVRAAAVDPAAVDELAALVEDARAPVLVVGAGADDAETWAALVALAERLAAPVWQEAFGARAGFPQDHPLFAGQLPADRPRLRSALDGHDLVLAVGAPVFRQYPFMPGPLVAPGTRVAIVTDDPAEAHRSPADLAVLAPPAAVCGALAARVDDRSSEAPDRLPGPRRPALDPPGPGEALRAGHVFAALADAPPASTPWSSRSRRRAGPSSRRACRPARRSGSSAPRWAASASRVPGAIGVRLALPDRPVVAIVGDGAALYQVQALWSAARYGAGVLFVVLANGRYAIMDRLAERHGEAAPWPAFEDIRLAAVAEGLGCPARRIETHEDLLAVLDEVVPGLAQRATPLVLDVVVEPDPTFAP